MNKILSIAICSVLAACASSAAPPPSASPTSGAQASSATKPERAKVELHMKDHVKYPASRDAILAACADTPEFSAGEKAWLASNLPAGQYKAPDDVVRALPFRTANDGEPALRVHQTCWLVQVALRSGALMTERGRKTRCQALIR